MPWWVWLFFLFGCFVAGFLTAGLILGGKVVDAIDEIAKKR